MFCVLIQTLLFVLLNFPVLLYVKDLRLYSGRILVDSPMLKSPVEIYRESNDIPHIRAKTLKEAFFGLGFCHGQDRLFAITFKRLVFSGRLAEFFGESFLEMDSYYRNLLLMESCKENIRNMDQDEREHLEFYVAGINEFANSVWFLPNEFYLTGLEFEPFKVEDGIILWKFLSYALTFDWQHEILREKLAECFSEEEAEEMTAAFSRFHFDPTVILNDEELKQSGLYNEFRPTSRNRTRIPRAAHNFSHHTHHKKYVADVLFDIMDTMDNMERGSNNWVLHGNLTKNGKPIMANDPHLDNHMPCLWYLVEMIYGEDNKFVIGATLPGLPFIFAGRTQFFAWGATTLHTDTADIYKEVLSNDGEQYLYDGQYIDLEMVEEVIKVKDSESVHLIVKKTKHGPLLPSMQDLYNVDYELPNANVSLAWVGYESKDTTYKTLLSLYQLTENTAEINRIFGGFICPFMNIVYATTTGDIGYYAAGKIPIRTNPEESFFLRGELKDNDWLGFIPNKESPQIINPKKGFIVTANNKMATDNIIHRRSLHMLPSARAMRIEEMIQGFIARGEKIGVDDVKRMQMDVKDIYAHKIAAKMLDLVEGHSEKLGFNKRKVEILKQMVSILRGWDFEVRKESVAACIYNFWEFKFLSRLLGKIQDPVDRERLVYSLNFEQFILRKISQFHTNSSEILRSEPWCQNPEFPVPEAYKSLTCIHHLTDSLFETYTFLYKNLGPDVEKWRWGRLHSMKYRHVPFSELQVGRMFYEKEYEADGNRRTVNVAIPNFRSQKFDAVHSANLRLVVEMGGEAWWSIDTGVSENRFAWNYVEGMEKHRKGEYWKMKFGVSNLKGYEQRLTLEPKF